MAKATTPKKKKINFSFDTESGREVLIAGSFNDWAIDPSDKKAKVKHLKEDGKQAGHYSISMFLAPGEHEYKFYTDNEWHVDPNAEAHKQNVFGTFNSMRALG